MGEDVRSSFVFYRSWLEAVNNLPREVRGDVLTAIVEYGLTGETTEPQKPITKAMLALIKPQIDSNRMKYDNGKKGGRPKSDENQNETKAKPNENQNETKAKPNVICSNVECLEEKPKPKGLVKKKDDEPSAEREAKRHYGTLVLLTETEYAKLEADYGADAAEWMVKKLDDYKAAHGRTYKSDYRAILSWVVDEYERKQRASYERGEADKKHDRRAGQIAVAFHSPKDYEEGF